jgi:hypothetical protein
MTQGNSSALSGQLTDSFRIPTYAQGLLTIVSENGESQLKGKQGQYHFDTLPEGVIRLTYGGANGPTLAYWDIEDWPAARWDGRVKIGGFIERLHAREVGGLEVVIAEVVGGPLPSNHVGLPSLDDMRGGSFARPSDIEPLINDQAYPFIILAESNLAALAQDALVSGIAVDAYGELAADQGQWHEIVGLPLLMDSLTILAP